METLGKESETASDVNGRGPKQLGAGRPGARFTKYLTIYRKIIVRSTYDSVFKSAKISFMNIVS